MSRNARISLTAAVSLIVVGLILIVAGLADARSTATIVPNFDPANVHHGDTVTFSAAGLQRNDSATIELDCFSEPYYYLVLRTEAFPLGHAYTLTAPDWQSGGGDCTATLFSRNIDRHDQSSKVLASFTFEVEA